MGLSSSVAQWSMGSTSTANLISISHVQIPPEMQQSNPDPLVPRTQLEVEITSPNVQMRAVGGHQSLFCFANLSCCMLMLSVHFWCKLSPRSIWLHLPLLQEAAVLLQQRWRGKITRRFRCPLMCWCKFHNIPSDALKTIAQWCCLCSPSYNIQISLSNETGDCPKLGSMLLPPISRLATCRLGWIRQRGCLCGCAHSSIFG